MQKLPVMWDIKTPPKARGTCVLLLAQPRLPSPATHRQQEFKPKTFSIKTLDKGEHSVAVQMGAPAGTAANCLFKAPEAPQASSSSHAYTSSINISAGRALKSVG